MPVLLITLEIIFDAVKECCAGCMTDNIRSLRRAVTRKYLIIMGSQR